MAEESWTAIVVTTQDHSSAQAFLKELEFHQKKGYIASSTLLLCVEDPRCKVGSGGATLNALLVVAEHLSAMSGHTVVTSDVLRGTRILLCHVGTHFPFSACQRGFTALPIEMHGRSPSSSRHTELPCIIDLYLDILTHLLAVNAPPGLWVCSTDRILCIPHDTVFSWDDSPDVRIFAVPKDVDKAAASNGACKISENGAVEDIIYNGTKEDIQKCQTSADGKVPTLSGVVYMNSTVAETLLSLHVRAPLEACTYIGLDSAVKPVKNLSLFYDILLAMATGVKENDFVAGRRSGEFSTRPLALDAVDKTNRKMARQLLWDALSGYTMKAVTIENGDFNYVYACARDLHEILHNFPYHNFMRKGNIIPKKHLNAAVHKGINEKEHTIINSIVEQAALGEETVILHSNIPERVVIGKRCLVSNLLPGDLKVQSAKFQVADELVIQALTIKMRSGNKDAVTGKQRVVLVWGLNDNLNMSIDDESSTFCNESWDKFHKRTEIAKSELWNPDMDGKKSLMNARIFPVYNPSEAVDFLDLLWLQGSFADQSRLLKWRSSWRLSIADIVSIYDSEAELSQRRLLLYDIGKKMTERILLEQSDRSLLPFFRFCTLEGFFEEILAVLDTIASQTTINQRAALSRTFACIADVIGARANGRGGLRSGPAANVAWQEGIELLKQDKVVEAIAFFSRERKSWFSRPDLLVRAARHYEGAFQVQVRKAVNTARQFIKLTSCDMVPIGKYVTAQAPARVDIAGTWSDTPPICYEHGGSVITAGVKIDSKKPIGCRVKRIPEPYVILILGRDENMMRIECKELEDLTNYHQVNSPGTLLKAAFFCANILSEDSDDSLQQQLLSKYNGGLILQTWSELPHGSGMGTSSILAGTILAALWKVIGKEPDVDAVVHAVLDLEQMMTTGGGWQDNVGGLAPGIKEGSSKRGLPLHVTSMPISMPDGFLQKFQKHLILIFSGKTRLARNMLQDVLRNWNARLPAIVKTADNLVENAKNCIQAFNKGDLEAIGHTMNTCWEHKKLMAPGCEPEICKIIMDSVRPVSYGQCLAGAGGGGFMYVITKNENAVEEIRSILSDLGEKGKKATVHAVEIDNEGLKIEIEQ